MNRGSVVSKNTGVFSAQPAPLWASGLKAMLGKFAENTPVFLKLRLFPLPGDKGCTALQEFN